MARIPATLSVFVVAVFFFSLTISHSRTLPGNEVTTGYLPSSLPESDVTPVIHLPSDSLSHSNEPLKEAQNSEILTTIQSTPMDVVSFRPADHRIRLRSRFPFRCRHHHHHHRFFMPMMRQHQEIPYGNDMIVASGENADFEQGMFQGGLRGIPGTLVRIHHHHHRHRHHDDEDENGDDGISMKFKMHKHHHHHHEDHEELDKEDRFKEHEERKEKAGGFFKSIRKFLDHF